MKEARVSTKMRWIAGVIYGLLALYEVFTLKEVLSGAAITNIPIAWLMELAVLLGAGIMAVWMLCGREIVKPEIRRAVVVATALVVLFELLTYEVQAGGIGYTLAAMFPNTMGAGSNLYQLIGMIVRLLLMILAAFFVQSASAEMDIEKAEADAEDAAEDLDEALNKAEAALENGVDEEEAAEVVKAVEEARQELAEALDEMDEALEEAEEEAGK